MIVLLVLLTAHFVGDFLLQSNRMAMRKAQSLRVLVEHVTIYTAAVALGVDAWFRLTATALPADQLALFAALTWATHFGTDIWTSRLTSRLWFIRLDAAGQGWRQLWSGAAREETAYWVEFNDPKRHWFFVVIGLDQCIHAWTLALTWMWVVR
jgi:hypothetical protein